MVLQNGLPPISTVSLRRPFARLRLRTARPDLFSILVRNPCVLDLFTLWGWYVLFISFSSDSRYYLVTIEKFDCQELAGACDACAVITKGGMTVIPQSTESLSRAIILMEKYQDIPMDFADATLVVLAEETGINDIVRFYSALVIK